MNDYHVAATTSITIKANSREEAAAALYQAMRDGRPAERIQVWERAATPTGGIDHSTTMWTFEERPREIVYKQPAPVMQTEAPPQIDAPQETEAPPQTDAQAS